MTRATTSVVTRARARRHFVRDRSRHHVVAASAFASKKRAVELLFARELTSGATMLVEHAPPRTSAFRSRVAFGIIRDDLDGTPRLARISERGDAEEDELALDGVPGVRDGASAFAEILRLDGGPWASVRESIRAVNVLSNRDGTEIVLASTHARETLDEDEWRTFAETVRARDERVVGVVCKRKKMPNALVGDRDYVVEKMGLPNERTVRLIHREGSFSNPNGDVAEQTAIHLCDYFDALTRSSEDEEYTFVELYAGCGNHTVCVAPYFAKRGAYAVEVDANLVEAARENFALNGLSENFARVVCMPAEEWVRSEDARAISGEAGRVALLVDPPRAGLDARTLDFVTASAFDVVVYVACDHSSLRRDVDDPEHGFEARGYEMRTLAVFDHAPTSARWIEVVATFHRKSSANASDI